ncbi:MAG: enoyl-CoA hydratase/isomerase family protein [Candidatus Tectomicrobia bacterium]|uniref:Enoyl-CoA hydratase/isomerase family protein n=1 Tax=Tectimicrobiota bacterium TaxID=2528274 RepID=A0A932FZK7_UNCTE|nr:enoyl-CoA hydratase/isomerase family protein [Candidatus Tectomicrobia bacterium]
MELKNLLYEKRDKIAVVTINRGHTLNSLNAETMEELDQVFREIGGNEEIWAVILTGAGERAFVSGADIQQFTGLSAPASQQFARRGQEIFRRIEELGKPVIAAINGYALGGGCELAMACTLRIASEKARFGQPEVKLGLLPGYGGTWRLPHVVGKGKAMELILTGEMIDAQEALRLNLVNQVVPGAQLMEAALGMANKILANSPLAVKLSIQAVNHAMDTDLETGNHHEAALFGICFASQDKEEGVKAFLEKRKPAFTGR